MKKLEALLQNDTFDGTTISGEKTGKYKEVSKQVVEFRWQET